MKHDQMLNCYKAHVCLKFDWSKTGLLPPDQFQNCHFKINCSTENTLCAQLKNGCYPSRTCMLDVTTFYNVLGIYHLLPFGSSELHVFVHRFFIQTFCVVHSIIHWFVPSFPSRLHSVLFLYSFDSCIHFHASIHFHSCIHFHLSFYFHFYIYDHSCIHYFPTFIFIHELILFTSNHHFLYNILRFIHFKFHLFFTFLHNSELLLKEDNDKYLKLAYENDL